MTKKEVEFTGFTLYMGRRSWVRSNEDEFDGNFQHTNIVCSTEKDIHSIVTQTTNIKSYRIVRTKNEYGNNFNHDSSRNIVFDTEDITKFFSDSKKDAEEHERKMTKAVRQLNNSIPKRIDVTVVTGVKLFWERGTDYDYKPSYSSGILRPPWSLKYEWDDKIYDTRWTPSDSIDKLGRVRIKTFKENDAKYFKFWNIDIDPKQFVLKLNVSRQAISVKERKIIYNG